MAGTLAGLGVYAAVLLALKAPELAAVRRLVPGAGRAAEAAQ